VLLALRNYIAKEKYVSIVQLARVFQMDVKALEPMLEVWVARGVIAEAAETKACAAACLGCRLEISKHYQFLR
jgi:hypothetical protein